MKNFGLNEVKQLRPEIEEALKVLAAKYDIKLELGNCSYSSTNINWKLKVTVNNPEALNAEIVERWNKYCDIWNFKKEHLGTEFTMRGERYKILGLKNTNSKFNLSAERLTDKKHYCFIARDVAKTLGLVVEGGL